MRSLTGTACAALFLAAAALSPAAADNNGLEAIHELKVEGRHLCMVGHFHYSQGHSQQSRRLAEQAAILDWANLVALEYGSDWWSWRIAADSKTKCERSNGIHHCYIEGRPCRPVKPGGK